MEGRRGIRGGMGWNEDGEGGMQEVQKLEREEGLYKGKRSTPSHRQLGL